MMLSAAAVLSVYGAGYARTRSAADRFSEELVRRRPAVPGPPQPSGEIAGVRPAGSEVASRRDVPVPVAAPSSTHAPSGATREDPPPPEIVVSSPTRTHRPLKKVRAQSPGGAPVATASAASTAAVPSTLPTATTPPATPTRTGDTASASPVEPAPVQPAQPAAAPVLKDGTYTGWGTSRHGDIQAEIVVDGGRITSARIAQCWTRYSCSWVAHLPGQVVTRQSAEVDYVTGATQSANAFYYAIVEALGKAK